jgi:hypothetical protein
MQKLAAFTGIALFALSTTGALAQNGCPEGAFSVINSPDGSTLSILFDNFAVKADPATGQNTDRKECILAIPLNLPEGFSLGIYKVDYRGFSRLFAKEYAELNVDYALGVRNKSRRYTRKIKGVSEGDFLFTETIGAGLMKRVGCGESAVLKVAVTLEIQAGGQPQEAMASLDSADGAPKGGLIYHFDLKKCE